MASRNGNSAVTSMQAGDVILVNTAALAIAGFVSFSLLIWDFICYIPAEIRLLKDFRKVELWRMPDPWAFILTRYSSFAFAIASLYTLSLKTEECQLAASLTQVLSIGVVAASGILVARRTIMLWANDTAVATLLATMYVVMIASWVATATQYRSRSSSFPLSKFGTNCALQTLPPWNPINYAASTVFFTLTLLLSIYRMAPRRTDFALNLGLTPINRGCIWYFLVNALTSLALFIVSIDHPSWTTEVAKRSAKPFFVVLVAAMSHRIYLNNQVDHVVRRKGLEEMTRPTQTANKPDSRPRWSFVPIRRKPVPFPTELETVIQIYPRPPPPPPSVPTSPIPRQHMASLERSRKESQTSFTTSSGSSEIVFQSPSAASVKLPSARASHGRGDSSMTNAPMSPSSAGVGSPTSVLSTIAFGSPPDSPAVLSFPALGKQRRVAQEEGRSSFGSVWTSSGGSHSGTPRRGVKRLSSPRSGWTR